MATTTGLVQQVKYNPYLYATFAWIGPTPTNTQLFYVLFRRTDATQELAIKRSLAHALTLAQLAGAPVTASHGTKDVEITALTIGPIVTMTVVDQPIQQDFFSVVSDNVPTDAVLVFKSAAGTTAQITPDLIRPQLAFVAKLPTSVPVGPGTLQMVSASTSWSTLVVPVNVSAGPPLIKRVLQPGAAKTNPFTFVIAADPALTSASTGALSADPVLTNRSGYHDIVLYCLRNWLTLPEDAYRASGDANIRFVSIFDASLPSTAANSLATTYLPNIIGARPSQTAAFATRYGETADLFFAITGDPNFTRSSAFFSADDNTRGGVAFTYDGVAHTHGYFVSLPGCAAIPLAVDVTSPTALHELGHAVSNQANGAIVDLYVDGAPGGFQVNKKFRAAATDPVPANFATYNGTTYASDPNRDTLGYPAGWLSYHCQLIDATRPNIMDNFWYSNPYTACRFDRLTHQFVADRLAAKFSR